MPDSLMNTEIQNLDERRFLLAYVLCLVRKGNITQF